MFKQSSIYALAGIIRQLVGFLMLPIYTNYLSPKEYGVIGLAMFMVGLVELVFGARLMQAIHKYFFEYEDQSKGEGARVISTAMILTGCISLIGTLVLAAFRENVSVIAYGNADEAIIIAIFSALLFTNAIENYSLAYLRILRHAWIFLGLNLGKFVLQVALNIWFVVFLEMGAVGVAVGALLASLIISIPLGIYTIISVGVTFDRVLAKRMLIFSWPLWLAGFAALYIGSSNRYFIRVLSNIEEVGLFELAVKFGSIITILVWRPFALFWQSEKFQIYKSSDSIGTYQDVFDTILVALFVAGLGVSLMSPTIIVLMSSSAFHNASSAVPYLAYAGVFFALTNYCNFGFLVKEKTVWISYGNYFSAGVLTVLYFILIPSGGGVGAAISVLLANMTLFIFNFCLSKRSYDMKLRIGILIVGGIISVVANALVLVYKPVSFWAEILFRCGVLIASLVFLGSFVWGVSDHRKAIRNFFKKDESEVAN